MLILLVLVALQQGNSFFVTAVFALVSDRADQIEPRAAAGSVRAQKTLAAMRNVSQMMAGAQLGITLCSLGLGAVGEPAVAHLPEEGESVEVEGWLLTVAGVEGRRVSRLRAAPQPAEPDGADDEPADVARPAGATAVRLEREVARA